MRGHDSCHRQGWHGERRHARPSVDALEGWEGRGGRGHHRRGGRRILGHGDLRLLVLELVAAAPAHGYELIKAIEERTEGHYVPSPGVIYPTLSMLEDAGHVAVEQEGDGKKLYAATEAGRAVLAENDEVLAQIRERLASGLQRYGDEVPAPILRAMENLKLALRLKLRGQPLPEARQHEIAALIDQAAISVERL